MIEPHDPLAHLYSVAVGQKSTYIESMAAVTGDGRCGMHDGRPRSGEAFLVGIVSAFDLTGTVVRQYSAKRDRWLAEPTSELVERDRAEGSLDMYAGLTEALANYGIAVEDYDRDDDALIFG